MVRRPKPSSIGLGPISLGWHPRESERDLARQVTNLLEDRRMLWRDFSVEIEEHCIRSAEQARTHLGALRSHPDVGPYLDARIAALQGLFRSFMDEVGPGYGDGWDRPRIGIGTDPLSVALGRLRALVGVQVADLIFKYDLTVSDDLATIVPDEAEWFFGDGSSQ